MLINNMIFIKHNKSAPSYYVYKLLLEKKGINVTYEEMRNEVYNGIPKNSLKRFEPKDLHTFLKKMGFSKDIKNIFFDVNNKESIKLVKYVTDRQFKDSKIAPLKDINGKLIKSVDIPIL